MRTLSLVFLLCSLTSVSAFTGRVIGVADGDTISVLRNGEVVRIRVEGIDCPELGAAFSAKAKKFTSVLVYDKSVEVQSEKTDRYGRLVARVFVNGQDLSLALIQAGLAWHYKQFSSDPVLAQAELTAQAAEIGIWSLDNPIPPWEARAKGGVASGNIKKGQGILVYRGNRRSRVFHAPGCRYFNCKNCSVVFRSREEAINAGYRPGGHCKP